MNKLESEKKGEKKIVFKPFWVLNVCLFVLYVDDDDDDKEEEGEVKEYQKSRKELWTHK